MESEIYEQGKSIKEAIEKLTKEVSRFNNHFDRLSRIAGETGLDLSFTTLRNLEHLLAKDGMIEKINPHGCEHTVFMEVLQIDFDLALRLRDFFWCSENIDGLHNIESVTPELIEKMEKHFILRKKEGAELGSGDE